ncbi:cupin domain-containing protein [Blastococcus sp. URHD0036]|uniref:cupin domain-containing protein n=1 Tax=Blastococcus sp. URHD0036 TaxID=1380356 RepID=UPI000497AD11|nr:hypothetical protein [Blastococcus sp. URHD0036]
MAATVDAKGFGAALGEKTAASASLFFLDELEWVPAVVGPNGEGGGKYWPESIIGTVDLQKFFDGATQFKYVAGETFNLLYIKAAPNITIPRHSHNMPQSIVVLEGEIYRGKRRFAPGDGYFSRAHEVYTIRAGAEGATYLEIRQGSLSELETRWVEDNPKRWIKADGTNPLFANEGASTI